MNKIKSIVVLIMVITATVLGTSACHNKKCKDGSTGEKASCCKNTTCCDKCSNECTAENKCCDKCKVGGEKACCKKGDKDCGKDSATCAKTEKDACCKSKKDSTKQ